MAEADLTVSARSHLALRFEAALQELCEVFRWWTTAGHKRSVSGIAEIDRIFRQLPAERHEMSAAAFHDLLVILKHGIADGKLLFTMTSSSHLPGTVGISPEG
jgi:hypothetical protein